MTRSMSSSIFLPLRRGFRVEGLGAADHRGARDVSGDVVQVVRLELVLGQIRELGDAMLSAALLLGVAGIDHLERG